jgi:Ca-activated chloride channel family protein
MTIHHPWRQSCCIKPLAPLPFAVALLLCGAASLDAQAPRRSTDAPAQGRIRVEVSLTSVVANVQDRAGRPVPDLPREAFELYEDGVRQKVELFETETSQPLDLVLMIDSSLSTLKELEFEREAGARFITRVVRPGDRMAVFQISETVTQLSSFTEQVPLLQDAVRGVQPGTATALYDAVYLGGHALQQRPPGRRRVIVLVTDAGETVSDTSFASARDQAIRSEAMLYTILIRAVKNESGRNTAGEHALINITDQTGGAMYRADSPAELDPIFDRINRELRTQYRLAYYPTPRPPARSYRSIQLRLAGDVAGLHIIRHRRSYYTGEE